MRLVPFFLLLQIRFWGTVENIVNGDTSVTVAAAHFPPVLIVRETNGNITYSGFIDDFFKGLAKLLKIDVKYVLADPIEMKRKGLKYAMLDQLLNNEVEILPFGFAMNEQRKAQMDFSFPLNIGSFRFIMLYPEKESTMMAIVKPFSLSVWFGMITSTVALLVFVMIVKHKNGTAVRSVSVNDVFINFSFSTLVRGLSGNYNVIPYSTGFPVRLAVGLWLLMMVVFLNAYTSCVTSFLTAPKFKPTVSNFEELAASHHMLLLPIDSDFSKEFLEATSEPYKSLGNSLRRNPFSISNGNLSTVLPDLIVKYDGVYAGSGVLIQAFIAADMKKHGGNCRLTASKPLNRFIPYPVGLRKGSPFYRFINKGVLTMWEYGFVGYWMSTYLPNIDKCIVQPRTVAGGNSNNLMVLNINHFASAFTLLGIGILISMVVFALESMNFKLRLTSVTQ